MDNRVKYTVSMIIECAPGGEAIDFIQVKSPTLARVMGWYLE
jgi:hypothetical protein